MSKLCLQCGLEIPKWKNNINYCSKECFGKSRLGIPNLKLRKRIIKICPVCGKEYETGGRAGSINQIYCSVKCMNYSKRKSLNEPGFNRSRTIWKELSKQLKSDSNYTCKLCREEFPEIKLNTHHVIPSSRRGTCDRDNLMVLCIGCHAVIERLTKIGYQQNSEFSPQKLIEDIKKNMY